MFSPTESTTDKSRPNSARRHFSQDSLFLPCDTSRVRVHRDRFGSASSHHEVPVGESWSGSDDADRGLESQSKLGSDPDDMSGTQLSQSLTSGLSHLTVVAASASLREKNNTASAEPIEKVVTVQPSSLKAELNTMHYDSDKGNVDSPTLESEDHNTTTQSDTDRESTAIIHSQGQYPLLGQVSPLWSTGKRKRERSLLELPNEPPKPQPSATVPSSAISTQDSRSVVVSRPNDIQLDPREIVSREYGVQLRPEPGRRRLRMKRPVDETSDSNSCQNSTARISGGEGKLVRRRSSSVSGSSFSSPSTTTSTDTHTHLSTENLALELRQHMLDSLSDKEHHVRRVRSRLRKDQRRPDSLAVPSILRLPNPLTTASAEIPDPSAPSLSNDSLRRFSLGPLGRSLFGNLDRASISILFPNSTATTTGLISSITEADLDLSELSDDVAREIIDIRHSVNLGWAKTTEEEQNTSPDSTGQACVSAPCSPGQFDQNIPLDEPDFDADYSNLVTPRRPADVESESQPGSDWRRSTR
ncbi:unnamed protein product [Echinostoma caproni]|uniref:RING-type domain-containing protein n=1 Tax=Echinostoma caproni TaxID=27848 RepID=A0A183AFH3_9TREM|nr:unnamed protein product [Echinostoma caproni]